MAISESTLKTIYKSLTTIALAVIVLYLSYIFIDIIILLVISIFIAMIFHPLVTLLENQGIKRIFSVLLVFALSGILIFFGLNVLIPKIANQINALAVTFNRENINSLLQQVEIAVKEYIPFIQSEDFAIKLEDFFSGLIFNSVNNISNIVTSIVSVVSISIIVPFMTFFILKDNTSIINGIINIMPNKYFEFSYYVITEIGVQLGRFIRGWIFDAFIVGFLAALGLAILGIQNSIIIGFIAGIGHLIPYFGPVIGGLPALIISLIQFGDMSMLPEISILFILIYSIDNGYIQPNILSKSTDMHPLMIILLILMGSQLMGILGMLIAIPAATVIKTAAKEFYFGYKNYKIIRT
jgi:predicted PurR-regulated permease PerM